MNIHVNLGKQKIHILHILNDRSIPSGAHESDHCGMDGANFLSGVPLGPVGFFSGSGLPKHTWNKQKYGIWEMGHGYKMTKVTKTLQT